MSVSSETTAPVLLRKIRSAAYRFKTFVRSQRFGMSPDAIYDGAFYDGGAFDKTEETARHVVHYLIRTYAPRSVLDIGCGKGSYLRHFADAGCLAVGCEGSIEGIRRVPSPATAFQFDLRRPLRLNRRFSLTMCIEVAEHIPSNASETLVESVCRHAEDVIVFSAAPPSESGTDHINCRPKEFWHGLFLRQGWRPNIEETAQLCAFSRAEGLPQWWREWTHVYRKQ
ncbi:class I SAM-dependent methyltransferase [Methylosinus sporium]|uniref:Class I SAM-dependent methyltransferase n=2 Tax=Methylosinus TaxID=425 RepID=A0A549T4I6_METSR|nr:methyltransferase domain-containing protein [Methylosinus sporium]TRL36809.1 class I SAM-dependent methyltransferase [Methylosinus sporium]